MAIGEEVTYRASEGDVLDHVIWSWYGNADMLPAVLERNPGLAAAPLKLPAGTLIVLPPAEPAAAPAAPDLWT